MCNRNINVCSRHPFKQKVLFAILSRQKRAIVLCLFLDPSSFHSFFTSALLLISAFTSHSSENERRRVLSFCFKKVKTLSPPNSLCFRQSKFSFVLLGVSSVSSRMLLGNVCSIPKLHFSVETATCFFTFAYVSPILIIMLAHPLLQGCRNVEELIVMQRDPNHICLFRSRAHNLSLSFVFRVGAITLPQASSSFLTIHVIG